MMEASGKQEAWWASIPEATSEGRMLSSVLKSESMPLSLRASMLSTLLRISTSRSLAALSFGPSAHEQRNKWTPALMLSPCSQSEP